MANVIKTVFTYPLDGTTTDFTIPFEYLARKFVVVTLIGQDRKELVVTTDYRFATRTTISLTRAWGPADNYQSIEIRRYTSASERLVDFSDGSILRATDLNVAQIQTLHVAEEARDLTADTIGVNNDGDLDARGRKIVNLADGVDAGDAVSYGQLERWNTSALNSANNAKTSENNAKTSETNSKASENAAKTSETNSATNATNSSDSALLAQKWAINGVDVPVTTGLYSAFHWATKSGGFANASMGYRDAANLSAIAAKASEDASATNAANAKSDADRAQTANPDNQLKKAENLNDVANKDISRTNLDVFSKAEVEAMSKWYDWNDPLITAFITWTTGLTTPAGNLKVQFSKNQIRIKGSFLKSFGTTPELFRLSARPTAFGTRFCVPETAVVNSSNGTIFTIPIDTTTVASVIVQVQTGSATTKFVVDILVTIS